jgi:hypothetical protein
MRKLNAVMVERDSVHVVIKPSSIPETKTMQNHRIRNSIPQDSKDDELSQDWLKKYPVEQPDQMVALPDYSPFQTDTVKTNLMSPHPTPHASERVPVDLQEHINNGPLSIKSSRTLILTRATKKTRGMSIQTNHLA